MTVIIDLPEEILENIFRHFTRFEDIRRIGLVCSQWHRLAWASLTSVVLRKFPMILEGNQFSYLLRTAPYISELQMPVDTTDNHICKIGYQLRHLQILSLRRCRDVTNTGMAYLSQRRLKELYLSTSWNISTLDFLVGSVSTLEVLEVRGLDLLSDDSLLSLASAISEPFQEVKFIDFRDCSGITDQGFCLIGELFPNVEHIDVSGCSISIRSIKHFSTLNRLRKLLLWGCNQLDDSALEILPSFPRLKRLSIIECDLFTDVGFYNLSRSKSIERLEIGSIGITDKGVEYLFNITTLQKLSVLSNSLNLSKEHLASSVEERKPNLQFNFAQLAM